ncbi:MAG: alkaline phosphatase PhoX [Planctomycetota bacterium]|nr:alkaline phosphatase PhoX [Planctomycetota bacterium]
MSTLSRRHFIQRSIALSAGFAGLRRVMADEVPVLNQLARPGYGPLTDEGSQYVSLPAGFRAQVCSYAGQRMNDGLLVPGKHDGMGVVPGPDGLTILVRNHEISPGHDTVGPFDAGGDGLASIDRTKIFDPGREGFAPSRGGTTTLVYDTRGGREPGELVHHAMSLVGTEHNCAGGMTPRDTWISCEESVVGPGDELGRARTHGWCFEVPATVEPTLIEPVPIKPMGRLNHEAVAVDPRTGIVYMTEDRNDGILLRYIPVKPDRLLEGGRLQALAIVDQPSRDLRNWPDAESPAIPTGTVLATRWIDLDEVESPDDSLRYQGFDRGAARFARGEGMWFGNQVVYFACTTGGRNQRGQIWKYTPAEPHVEGTGKDAEAGGRLELFVEPNDATVIEHADNLTVAPWGDLVVCEDGYEDQFLLGVTPEGSIYRIARNMLNQSEFAGAVFSPDGSTLFVNIQNPGMTLAITGPWDRRRS